MTNERHNGVAATEIVAAYDRVVAGDRDAFKNAIAFGDLLLKARGNSTHGTFLKWLKVNCKSIGKSTAYKYMDLADPAHRNVLEANFHHDGNMFSLRGAMRLIKPRPTQQEKDDKKAEREANKAQKTAAAVEASQVKKRDLEDMLRERAVDEIAISIDQARQNVADLEALASKLRERAIERRASGE
jgi:hypothetical protein